MTRLLLAGAFVSLSLAPAAAQGETWCLRSFGQEKGACVFSSGQECTQAATFNAFGGVCEREALGGDKRTPKPRTPGRG